jgi:hypothetical protein
MQHRVDHQWKYIVAYVVQAILVASEGSSFARRGFDGQASQPSRLA